LRRPAGRRESAAKQHGGGIAIAITAAVPQLCSFSGLEFLPVGIVLHGGREGRLHPAGRTATIHMPACLGAAFGATAGRLGAGAGARWALDRGAWLDAAPCSRRKNATRSSIAVD